MTYRLACALALALLSTQARAESGVPIPLEVTSHIRHPMLPIPSDGVLLLQREDNHDPTIEVRDALGALLEGTLRAVGASSGGVLLAWVPTERLKEGTIEVTIGLEVNPEATEVVAIEVVAPFDAGPPELRSTPSASWHAAARIDRCCTTPNGDGAGCFAAHQDCWIRVDPGLSTAAAQAVLSQHLFRAVEVGTSTSSTAIPYRPLEDMLLLDFFSAADAYCVEIQSLHLATTEVHVHAELEGCASHENQELGRDLPIEPAANSLSFTQCPVPPSEYERAWCEINRDACEVTETCAALYAHVCNDGPPPDWPDDDTLDAGLLDSGLSERDAADPMPNPDPIDASFGPSARSDGCSVLGKPSLDQHRLQPSLAMLLAWALWCRRRGARARRFAR